MGDVEQKLKEMNLGEDVVKAVKGQMEASRKRCLQLREKLKARKVSKAVMIWSVGCVILIPANMISRLY